MNKFISLINPQSFYYLWHNKKTRQYLLEVIQSIINKKDNYKLLETFNKDSKNLRSYVFLESKSKIIYLAFNYFNNDYKLSLDTELITYLNLIYNKEIVLIILHNTKGNSKKADNIYHIFINEENNTLIKLFLSQNNKQQIKYDVYGIRDYLYNLDDDFYQRYLMELNKEENISKFLDL